MSTPRKKSVRAAVLAVATAATLALGACSGGAAGSGATGEDGTGAPLKVGLAQAVPADLMTQVAAGEGFFEERGVNVELVPATNAATLATSLVSNELDLTTMVPPLQWPAMNKGSCIKALNGTLGNSIDVVLPPGAEVEGDPTDPNTTMQALKGKSIGVTTRGSGIELWISALLEEAGMDPAKDVNFVAVGVPATAVQAFKQGQVDAVYYGPTVFEFLPEDEVTRVTDIVGREGNALSPLMQAYNTASCKTIDERPQDLLNYCKAMWDAYDFALDPANKDAMAVHFSELLGTSVESGAQSWKDLQAAFKPLNITEESWNEQAPLVANPEPEVPDYNEFTYAECASGDPR